MKWGESMKAGDKIICNFMGNICMFTIQKIFGGKAILEDNGQKLIIPTKFICKNYNILI